MKDKLMFTAMFSGIWCLVGMIFLIIGLAMLNYRKRKERICTSKTYGTVRDLVQHRSHSSSGGYSSSWHPVFEYHIGELTFIKESSYGSSRPKYAIGQNVEICYNPENYHEYYIAGDTLPRTLAVIFTIVGLAAILIAVFSAILILQSDFEF
ncbi:MAG: DUF3592 domain-containing protein [Clostridia bacterium]|nr:DUF3592 domain-containing protein [Clostridia bacterium]